LRLDTASIVAGLIHDVVEDTALTLEEIEERFGEQVALIVDGVTKIGKVRFRSHTEHQVENYRKLLLSMAEDARVILIKLADRLHNMRTLEHLPPEKRQRIALETREIYAPLAHRLGIASIKWELEDLAFKHLEPEAYTDLRKKVQQRRKERERQILEMQRPLEGALDRAEIPHEVTGRPKHLWSIYRKMRSRDKPYDEIYDVLAIRVLTDSVQSCYAALGVIHSKWTPITERFHDYVATPKSNMYRSLHTTVFGPGGRRYEIQIRTEEMHRTAEYGIAAHWRYKEGEEAPPRDADEDEVDEALTWFRQVLEWQQETKEPEEFMEFLRMDLFQGEIFVFTPKGDVKQLPTGATPIDFAYSVHTEVGFHCAGAKVNGRIAPLSRELRNGDTVEILTDPRQRPTRDWLAFVKTSRARQRIRQWIRKEEFDSAVELGRDFLERELKKQRIDKPTKEQMENAAEALGYEDFEHVQAALGRGDVGPTAVIRELFPEHDQESAQERSPTTLERIAEMVRRSSKGVRIQGMENLMVRYSQCCQPVPGDDVIGYITRGRGISIHRKDCPNVLNLDEERRVEIEWTAEKGDRFFVKLYVKGTDRRGLLSDVAQAITDTETNITHADMDAIQGGMQGEFAVEVRDLAHLRKVIAALKRVKGIVSVERRESFRESDLVEA
ncbi:MAG: RelA/SpoT family protein, partial [Gemmatimonadetes bacterium]|nr:bifunctional (p)ppGpp synthetase/guanosine-3',5'-bis(diphosphate) 3'-pyrophosphohydrolase [Gemmatimonadota bacterium]NIR79211.1 bifunctional (p)ppGpp synthetase/guanosine-3',5'-bis(diphosphate) 3'-pyrophosphohydrolase [Gemmatimonadota bacterium]NIT87872.1 bifunctional (p)ppGpp synthetase/guanosine-3',5'-bis(diphosphate) 3'-pyrophosphohydrolase [Gemmatimonadota bacterium]NIU31727.1 bifunctional (p)ppGpp synthetase/guanosine-3',5'-bis(diphosphate) 3'-pyrophosphohydrolase [Gemmatimonadota bacter